MPQIDQSTEQRKALLAAEVLEARKDKLSPAWIDAETWPFFTSKELRTPLYRAFSDEELLDILRYEADGLGRLPNKKDVFCVYREFIVWRFKNWPSALVAAGLKPPRRQRKAANRLRMERNDQRRRKQAEAQND